jgi:NitT/TauT family transport system substrate-binding protein
MREVEQGLGYSGAVAMIGFVFGEDFATKHADALRKFLDVSRQAKDILAHEDAPWPAIMTRINQDPAAAALFRRRYAEGVPRRPIADEQADAGALFKTLAEVGGAELVGPAAALDPGTYYRPGD